MEEGWQALGRGTWHLFHAFPGHGTIPGFAVGLGAAMLVGVAELAAASFTAYVSYRMFAYGEPLAEAIENAIKFESGKLREEGNRQAYSRITVKVSRGRQGPHHSCSLSGSCSVRRPTTDCRNAASHVALPFTSLPTEVCITSRRTSSAVSRPSLHRLLPATRSVGLPGRGSESR